MEDEREEVENKKLKDHLEHLDEYKEIPPEEFADKETEPGPTPQGRPSD